MRAPGQGTQITKNGKKYWRVKVVLRDELNRRVEKVFERKSLADAKTAATIHLAKYGRVYEAPKGGTLAELFEIVDTAVWSQTGSKNRVDMNTYRKYWVAHLGDVNIGDIDAPALTRVIHSISAGKSKSMIDKAHRCIRQAFAYAVSDLGWLTSSPADAIRSPKPTDTSIDYAPMTREEFDRMTALADRRSRLIIRLVGECGMRPIEAVRVRSEHLFTVLDRWLVRIPKSKTAAGVRSVPISDDLVKEIQARHDDDWEGISDPNDHIRQWWRDNSKTRLYDLRGWRSDEWRRMGVPDQLRSFLMGHTKPQTTQTLYETLTSEDTLSMFDGPKPKGQKKQGGKQGGKT